MPRVHDGVRWWPWVLCLAALSMAGCDDAEISRVPDNLSSTIEKPPPVVAARDAGVAADTGAADIRKAPAVKTALKASPADAGAVPEVKAPVLTPVKAADVGVASSGADAGAVVSAADVGQTAADAGSAVAATGSAADAGVKTAAKVTEAAVRQVGIPVAADAGAVVARKIAQGAGGVIGEVSAPAPNPPAEIEPMAFSLEQGGLEHHFYRDALGPVHAAMRSGAKPRMTVSFAANDLGAGLWFEQSAPTTAWRLAGPMVRPSKAKAEVSFEVALKADVLRIKGVVLGSGSDLSAFEAGTRSRSRQANRVEGQRVVWQKAGEEIGPDLAFEVEVLGGSVVGGGGAPIVLRGAGGEVRLKVTVSTSAIAQKQVGLGDLLTEEAASEETARRLFAAAASSHMFVPGAHGAVAGTGREKLLALRLLMPVMKPEAVESALKSILVRAESAGVVDFLVVSIAAAWLLDTPEGRARAGGFLSSEAGGVVCGESLVARLSFVMRAAAPFAASPGPLGLIQIPVGATSGGWRSTEGGLGGGRVPYDLNAVFVPAALESISRLNSAGLLAPYAKAGDFVTARDMAKVWIDKAPGFFEVRIKAEAARTMIGEYARALKVPDTQVLESVAGDIAFSGLSLGMDGAPVPVMHSDEGFALLLLNPSPQALEGLVETLLRPFPAGLLTPVGLLVANPAYAPTAVREGFTGDKPHGAVVWSWQQAVLAAGLSRQLARRDLPAATRQKLQYAEQKVWGAIQSSRELRKDELWSWSIESGTFSAVPFAEVGQIPAQAHGLGLLRSVFLAVRPPGY